MKETSDIPTDGEGKSLKAANSSDDDANHPDYSAAAALPWTEPIKKKNKIDPSPESDLQILEPKRHHPQ